ncbi:TetR/AcrR family transcriptional regulator [Neorhizobium sp. DT-125]|uniref:TetR/AcrR family transcriptional regulator n=1 Tax=Neorhizobium sp. DT-125 TaxID=3396163 RepID=UPI003F193856
MDEQHGEELTVALIAARADVPPSTIYRRWGSLQQLLEDVARERFLPDSIPTDTGSLRGDLEVWLEQLVDDISSGPGHALFRERINNVGLAQTAAGYVYQNLACFAARCARRDEPVPVPDRLMDLIFAPIVYRIFFTGQSITKDYQLELIGNGLNSPGVMLPFNSQPSIRDYVLYENDAQ